MKDLFVGPVVPLVPKAVDATRAQVGRCARAAAGREGTSWSTRAPEPNMRPKRELQSLPRRFDPSLPFCHIFRKNLARQ